jgi:hypothetical protein
MNFPNNYILALWEEIRSSVRLSVYPPSAFSPLTQGSQSDLLLYEMYNSRLLAINGYCALLECLSTDCWKPLSFRISSVEGTPTSYLPRLRWPLTQVISVGLVVAIVWTGRTGRGFEEHHIYEHLGGLWI